MVGMWLPPDIMDRTEKTPSHYRVRNCMSAQVDTVVLHQTSCARFRPRQLPHSPRTRCRPAETAHNTIVQLHPIDAYLVASSGFDDDAISVEVVGKVPN